jgi:translation initiation factor 4G
MPLTLEEIKKLPPKERIEKLKEFEEEQKRLKEAEEKKRKQESEAILRRSIEEIAEEEKKEEEEEEKELEKEELSKKKKEESLEEIAETAPAKKQEEQKAYDREQAYVTGLSRQPTSELYADVNKLRSSFEQKGYLNPRESERAELLRGAFYEKEKSGYDANERSQLMMREAERALEELQDPTTRKYK